jgi:hypothetical protein
MKTFLTLLIAIAMLQNLQAQTSTIYSIKLKDIDGKDINLADFKGKKILLVNVASECGYTPQYEDLQKLHEQYKKQTGYHWIALQRFWRTGARQRRKDKAVLYLKISRYIPHGFKSQYQIETCFAYI